MSPPESSSPPDNSKKPSKLTKWVLFALLFVCFVFFAYLYVADVAPPKDEEFLYQFTTITESNNHFTALAALGTNLKMPPDATPEFAEQVEAAREDSSQALKLLGEVSETLKQVDKILAAGELIQIPMVKYTDPALDIPGVNRIVRLLVLRAEYRAKFGEFSLASDDYYQLYRIGRSLAGKNTSLLGYFSAMSVQQGIHGSLAKSLSESKWGGADVAKLHQRVEGLMLGTGALVDSLCSEYTVARNMVGDGTLSQFTSGLNRIFFKPNKTRSFLFYYYKELIKDAQRSPKKRTSETIANDFIQSVKGWKLYFSDNIGGKKLMAVFLPTIGMGLVKHDESLYWGAAMRVFMALHSYSSEHGSLPEDLDALVPSHLDSIPLNTDGKPLVIYDAKNAQLLSSASMDEDMTILVAFPHLKKTKSSSK